MSEKIATTLYWKLTPVSPIHVGGTQEKHRVLNVDAIKEGDKLYFLNVDQLAAVAGEDIDKLTQYIETGCISKFFKKSAQQHPALFSDVVLDARNMPNTNSDANTEIKTFIRTQGQPYLPGSSLKGAIRTVLGYYLKKISNEKLDENKLFGAIQNNLMRFIQVSDAPITQTALVNSKILSVRKVGDELVAGWKNKRIGSDNTFQAGAFNNLVEVWPVGVSVVVRVNILDGLLTLLEQWIDAENDMIKRSNRENRKPEDSNLIKKVSNAANLQKLVTHDAWKRVFNEYFKIYKNKELSYLDKIIGQLQRAEPLLKFYQHLPDDKAYLRVAFGSGAWSMTGMPVKDFYQHAKNNFEQKGKAFKTRRVAFDNNQVYPMGWLKVEPATKEEYEDFLEQNKIQQTALKQQKEQKAANWQDQLTVLREEAECKAAEEVEKAKEAKMPHYTPWERVKDGTELDAVCLTPQSGIKSKKFKLFVGSPEKEHIAEVSYAAELKPDVTYRLRVKKRVKGKEQIQGLEFKGEK